MVWDKRAPYGDRVSNGVWVRLALASLGSYGACMPLPLTDGVHAPHYQLSAPGRPGGRARAGPPPWPRNEL